MARMKTPSIGAVEAALYVDRSVVRHHAMRRTIWVMTPLVARLAHAAATTKIAAAERRRTIGAIADSTDIGDPDQWLDDAYQEIAALLVADGPLTTRAIGKALPHLTTALTFGVRTKNPGSIPAHTKVLQGAGFEAKLVRAQPVGSWVSAEYHWSPTTHWLGRELAGESRDAAAAELLHHWLLRFGPATETDLRWWFGWTATLTRSSLTAIDAVAVSLEDGATGYVAAGDTATVDDPGPWLQLLPGLDPTAMGWKQRDWYIDPTLVPRLFDQFGNAGPTIWADGEIVGGWIQRPNGTVAIELARELGTLHTKQLADAITELEQSLGDVVVRPRFPAPAQKDLFNSRA